MKNLFLQMADMVTPPTDPEDPGQLANWRLSVSCFLVALAVVAVGDLLLAWSPYGFVPRTEHTRLSQQVEAVERHLLTEGLYDSRARQCAAIEAGNDEAVRWASHRVTSLLNRWFVETGSVFPLPQCTEVGYSSVASYD